MLQVVGDATAPADVVEAALVLDEPGRDSSSR